MKEFIGPHQVCIATEGTIKKYPEEFDGNTEIMAVTVKFAANNVRKGELLAGLSKPRSVIIAPRTDLRKKVRVSVKRMTGLGILISTRRNDETKVEMFKEYRTLGAKSNTWKLYQIAVQVGDELTTAQEVAGDVGLSPEKLAAFKTQVQHYGTLCETTDALLKQRKADRAELKALTKENRDIMRFQLDPYVAFDQEAHPSLFREYTIARKGPSQKKPPIAEEVLTELSGTANNSVTGQPVKGAVVMIAELNMVTTTDEDGFYMFDEVPVGVFTFSCHFTGFKVPADVSVTVTDDVPLQLNFILEPETEEPAV